MDDRPVSVTIVGWVLMIIGIISCISLLAAMNDSEVQAIMAHQSTPVWFQLGSSVVGLVVTVICGFVILKGKIGDVTCMWFGPLLVLLSPL